MSDSEIRFYPPWREAAKQFLEANFSFDEVIPFSWFYEAFGIEEPTPETTKGRADELELKFLGQFEKLRNHLLFEHQMDLVNERGQGYRIAPPWDQTKLASEDGIAEIRKGLRKMKNRLVNVDHAALSSEQKRENVDALARLSMMADIVKRTRRLPKPE